MRRLKRLPQNTPIRLPNVEITKEVKPMMTIGERIEVKEFIPTKANDIPMAKASMLVAIASVTTTFNGVEAAFVFIAEALFYHTPSQKGQ